MSIFMTGVVKERKYVNQGPGPSPHVCLSVFINGNTFLVFPADEDIKQIMESVKIDSEIMFTGNVMADKIIAFTLNPY